MEVHHVRVKGIFSGPGVGGGAYACKQLPLLQALSVPQLFTSAFRVLFLHWSHLCRTSNLKAGMMTCGTQGIHNCLRQTQHGFWVCTSCWCFSTCFHGGLSATCWSSAVSSKMSSAAAAAVPASQPYQLVGQGREARHDTRTHATYVANTLGHWVKGHLSKTWVP